MTSAHPVTCLSPYERALVQLDDLARPSFVVPGEERYPHSRREAEQYLDLVTSTTVSEASVIARVRELYLMRMGEAARRANHPFFKE